MKKSIYLLVALAAIGSAANAQTKIKDGTITSGIVPNSKAILDLESNARGLLLPRLTTVQRDAITTPPEGLIVFNTTDSCVNQYNRGKWNSLCETPDFCKIVMVEDDIDSTFTLTNPSTAGAIFSPANPQEACALYITEDGSTWTWNGTTYVTKSDIYVEPWWNKAKGTPSRSLTDQLYHLGSANVGTGVATGQYSMTVGVKDTLSGHYSLVVGTNNKITNGNSLTAGYNNYSYNASPAGNPNFILGSADTVLNNSHHNLIGGRLNVISNGSPATNNYNLVTGYNNKLTGNSGAGGNAVLGYNIIDSANHTLVTGTRHTITPEATGSVVGGQLNYVKGNHAGVWGHNNKDSANYTLVGGQNNTLTSSASGSIVGGVNNIATQPYSYVYGLNNKDSAAYTLISGNTNIVASGHYGTSVLGVNNAVLGTGNRNYIMGDRDTINTGTNNFLTGSSNTVNTGNNNTLAGTVNVLSSTNNSVVIGNANKVHNAGHAAVFGVNNVDSAAQTFMAGGNNVIGSLSAYSVAIGQYDTIMGTNGHNAAIGLYNKIDGGGGANITAGNGNKVTSATSSAVMGYQNIVTGPTGAFVTGRSNKLTTNSSNNGQVIGGFTNDVTNSAVTIVVGQENKVVDAQRSAVFGFQNTDSASYTLVAGNANKLGTLGSSSLVAGASNVVDQPYSTVTGLRNHILSTASTVNSILGGLEDTIAVGSSNVIIGGYRNKVDGNINASFLGGYQNKMLGTSTRSFMSGMDNIMYNAAYSTVMGQANKDSASYTNIVGYGNIIGSNSTYGTIAGYQNIIIGGSRNHILGSEDTIIDGSHNNFLTGAKNKIFGGAQSYNVVGGYQNKLHGAFTGNAIFGYNHLDSASYTLMAGQNNIVTPSMSHATVIGKFNKPITNALFTVGNGTSDAARSNVFTVTNTLTTGATTNGTVIFSAQLPRYDNEAAANNDASLPSGSFFKLTSNGAIYQKP